jgi:hypothetical protein
MRITITPESVNKYEEFEERLQDYPLYGHTSGLTRVNIIVLAKLLDYEFPNELTKPMTLSINW